LKEFRLDFNQDIAHMNSDVCLDAIFSLDQLSFLSLCWNHVNIEKIKSLLNKQGAKKSLETIMIYGMYRVLSDSDILDICAFLPSLKEWFVCDVGSALTIEGAREWKRICPYIEIVEFNGGLDKRGLGYTGVSEEVKEAFREMEVKVYEIE
jgi:hypothetical protein